MKTNVTRGRQIAAWASAAAIGGTAAFGGMWLHYAVQRAIAGRLPESSEGGSGGLGFAAGLAVGLMVASAILQGRPPLRGIVVGSIALTVLICLASSLDVAMSGLRSDLAGLIFAGGAGLLIFGSAAGLGVWWFKLYGSDPRDLKRPHLGDR